LAWNPAMTSLRTSVQRYLTMRRMLGFKLERHEAHLLDFVAFMRRHHARRITGKRIVQWVRENPSTDPSYQGLRFGAVRVFAVYHSAVDPRTEVPPTDLMPRTPGRNRFYLYSDDEVKRLLAQTLRPRVGATSISRWVRYTLYGLLSVTGLRIGEALRLNVTDVDLEHGILHIRDSKFRKSRLVPLHPSTRTALRNYLQRRNKYFHRRDIEPLFVSRHGTRMNHLDAWKSLVRLSRRIGLRGPTDRHGPRLHDFRHRAAVQVMLRCYRSGADPERRLPALSTYLGHTDLRHTYWYLHQHPALMKQAVNRLERCWGRAR
jgi:integrase/recombinase XerD